MRSAPRTRVLLGAIIALGVAVAALATPPTGHAAAYTVQIYNYDPASVSP